MDVGSRSRCLEIFLLSLQTVSRLVASTLLSRFGKISESFFRRGSIGLTVDYSPSRSEGEILLEYHVSDYSGKLNDLAGRYKFYWTRYLSLPIGFVNDPRGFLKSYGAEILKENVA